MRVSEQMFITSLRCKYRSTVGLIALLLLLLRCTGSLSGLAIFASLASALDNKACACGRLPFNTLRFSSLEGKEEARARRRGPPPAPIPLPKGDGLDLWLGRENCASLSSASCIVSREFVSFFGRGAEEQEDDDDEEQEAEA